VSPFIACLVLLPCRVAARGHFAEDLVDDVLAMLVSD